MKVALTSPAAAPATGSADSGGGIGLLLVGLLVAGLAYLGYQHFNKDKEEEKEPQ